jgi:chromosome partitioning protein
MLVDAESRDSRREAHAAHVITPLNDSFLDLDVLANVDSETFEPTGISHYAELVCEARRQRRMVTAE